MNQNTIDQILTAWGRNEHRVPLGNEALKQKALAKFKSLSFRASPHRYHAPWLSIAFAGLAAVMLFATLSETGKISPSFSMPAAQENSTEGIAAPAAQKGIVPDYFPRPRPTDVPITDTREFLKTDYYATIRTRHVQDLTRRAATTVRGFGGRVDSMTDSERSGFVNFVVPADKLDSFRKEVEGFVGTRFIAAQIQTENLLPQKQLIEKQRQQVEGALRDLRGDRRALVAAHNQIVAPIQSRLATIVYELATLRAEQTNDPVRKAQIAAQEQELLREQGRLQIRLSSENASYARQLEQIDLKIRETESSLEYVAAQDQGIVDTVATVRGTISIQWISIWEIVQLYVSPYWIALFFAVAAVAAYMRHRRQLRFPVV